MAGFGERREANEACGKIEGESMAKGFAMVVAQVGRDHIQRGAKTLSPCLKFPPHFCQAKWRAHAQPNGPDGTCVTKLAPLILLDPVVLFKRPLAMIKKIIFASLLFARPKYNNNHNA